MKTFLYDYHSPDGLLMGGEVKANHEFEARQKIFHKKYTFLGERLYVDNSPEAAEAVAHV